MYAYRYDEETGGIELLNDDTVMHSNEPRPVYAQEMDFIGMDEHWKYKKQNDVPYLWAEASTYLYRGKVIAKVKGGSLYEKPVLEVAYRVNNDEKIQEFPDGTELMPIDIPGMIKRNEEIMGIWEQIAVKAIFNYYRRKKRAQKGKKPIEYFHVAFSGGKDSIVLLDLVERALPKTSFIVIFGDTGMEFPDTYNVVDKVEQKCKDEGIEFYRAASHLSPMESWKIFGPPSQALRWCCTVHKAAPQTLKLREVLGKSDYVGADFVGVRKYESVNRANYDYENRGKKQKGQYSMNPILDWSSAEIWLYIYKHELLINETYKKGNARAGCLFCPMGGGKSDCFRNLCYPKEIKQYTDMIRGTINDKNIESYITNRGWINRKNGRDLIGNASNYNEEIKDGYLYITVTDPKTDWCEWMKTLGDLSFSYTVDQIPNGYVVKVSAWYDKTPEMKYFKSVFHKAASCIGCKVCEANCQNGCISFENGFHIENCKQCRQCHDIDSGCLLFHSIQMPKNGGFVMKSINTFADHAPKPEWVRDFFERQNEFLERNTLGPMQIQMFKRFLSEASLIYQKRVTDFFELVLRIGYESAAAWALILVNLAYGNPQIQWYIQNMPVGEDFPREYLETKITERGVSEKDAKSIVKAFKRLSEIQMGTVLHFGTVTMEGGHILSLKRTKAVVDDHRVILYSLFKYAEACGGYYQFTLSRLLDHTVDSAGISPTKLFGVEREEMEQFLNGLTARYPEFINATFTHDLEKISLAEDKTSEDVLTLFEG